MTQAEAEYANKLLKAVGLICLGKDIRVTAYCMAVVVTGLATRCALTPEEAVEILRQSATMIESGISPGDLQAMNDNEAG